MTTTSPPIRQFMTMTPIAIDRAQTLAEAQRVMKEHGIRHLPVVEHDGTLVGVLSARELDTICRLPDVDTTRIPTAHVARHDVFSVSPESPIDVVCATMAEQRYGCAVVLQDRKVLGIFTTTDACAALAAIARGNGAF